MKISTVIWKLKMAYNSWPPESHWDEFWQEVKAILIEFKQSIENEHN